MQEVIISIRPKWCGLIAAGVKTMEIRRHKPTRKPPFKVYIYCTSVKSMNLSDYVEVHRQTGGKVDEWSGKVIGEFVCNHIVEFDVLKNGLVTNWLWHSLGDSALTYDEITDYIRLGKTGYGWRITGLKIYDTPKPLSDYGAEKAPQSWQYIKEA